MRMLESDTATAVQEALIDALVNDTCPAEAFDTVGLEFDSAESYEEAGVLTTDKGIVLVVFDSEGNQHEFQISIVRSR
jgi:hypothetical protein